MAENSRLSHFILKGVNLTEKDIGHGSYGRVFEVDYQGTLCAAKEVHALLLRYAQHEELQKITTDFLNECQIWSTIRHPCIVQFLGVYYTDPNMATLPIMVMEKMTCSLRNLVEEHANVPLNVKLSILVDVCLGLRYLHSREPPIVHRDLTPNNILLGGHLEAKITDLGVAKVVTAGDKRTMTKVPGTPNFMPPEALLTKPQYGPPLDIFSYGAVVLYIITQQWPEPNDKIQFNNGKYEVLPEVARRQNYLDTLIRDAADLRSLVTSCLDDDPEKRLSVVEVSEEMKRVKNDNRASQDVISPIAWWAVVSSQLTSQRQQVKSSITEPIEKAIVNEELKKEVTDLKKFNDGLNAQVDNLKKQINDLKVKDEDLNKEITQLKEDKKSLIAEKNKVQYHRQVNQRHYEDDLVDAYEGDLGDAYEGDFGDAYEGDLGDTYEGDFGDDDDHYFGDDHGFDDDDV